MAASGITVDHAVVLYNTGSSGGLYSGVVAFRATNTTQTARYGVQFNVAVRKTGDTGSVGYYTDRGEASFGPGESRPVIVGIEGSLPNPPPYTAAIEVGTEDSSGDTPQKQSDWHIMNGMLACNTTKMQCTYAGAITWNGTTRCQYANLGLFVHQCAIDGPVIAAGNLVVFDSITQPGTTTDFSSNPVYLYGYDQLAPLANAGAASGKLTYEYVVDSTGH